MKFVLAGLFGALIVIAAGYLWFVPMNDVLHDTTATVQEVVGAFVGALQFNRPAMQATDPDASQEQGAARREPDLSRIPYPRPRRYTRRQSASAQEPVAPVVVVPASSDDAPAPALKATTLSGGGLDQTEVYVDDVQDKSVIVRRFEGDAVDAAEVPKE